MNRFREKAARFFAPIFRSHGIAIVVFMLLNGSCNTGKPNQKLTLAVAANMQFAMEELIHDFTQKTGISCDLVVSSSGKLAAQIREGAPYDVFVSADMHYPETLSKEGLGIGSPKVYAFGALVLWSLNREIDTTFAVLGHPNTRHIALANPETAPYGTATIEVLQNLGFLDSVYDKLVYGESISQVNQFLFAGAVDFGFTAKAVVLASQLNEKGFWREAPSNLYTPISQGILVLKATQNESLAKAFFDYLFTAEAADILRRNGYGIKANILSNE